MTPKESKSVRIVVFKGMCNCESRIWLSRNVGCKANASAEMKNDIGFTTNGIAPLATSIMNGKTFNNATLILWDTSATVRRVYGRAKQILLLIPRASDANARTVRGSTRIGNVSASAI